MLEDFKDGKIFTGIIAGYLLCLTVLVFGEYVYGNRNTDATISNIKEQQRSVSTEIGNATTNMREAENAVNGASSTINRVQGRLAESERVAVDNAREISNISKIVSECRSLAEENRAILNAVGKTD